MKYSSMNSIVMDVLRILACQFVLFGHCFYYYGVTRFDGQQNEFCFQNCGVVMLFIISGFFISMSIKRRMGEEYLFTDYVIDRASRIGVAYVPALFVVGVIDLIHIKTVGHDAITIYLSIKNLLANLLMLQGFPFISDALDIQPFGTDRPLWTLSIEWWIYIAFGFSVLVIYRAINSSHLKVYHVLILIALVMIPALMRIDITITWIMGSAAFALFYNTNTNDSNASKFVLSVCNIVVLALIVLFIIRGGDPYSRIFAFLISSLIYFLNCLFKDTEIRKESLSFKTIKFFSGYSYSLFLLHYPILDFFAHALTFSPKVNLLITVCVANVIAIVFSKVFENKPHIAKKILLKVFKR